MNYAGENGVASYGAIMYVNFILYPRSLVTPLEVLRSSVIIMVLQITKSLKIYFEKHIFDRRMGHCISRCGRIISTLYHQTFCWL